MQVARVPDRHAATGHIHDAGHNLFRVVFRVRRVGGMDQSQQTSKDGYKVRTNRNTHRELEIDLSLCVRYYGINRAGSSRRSPA